MPVETDIIVVAAHPLLPVAVAAAARPSKVLSARGIVWAAPRFLEVKRAEAVDEKPCCHLGRSMALAGLPMSVVVVGTNAVTVLMVVGGQRHVGCVDQSATIV